MNHGLIKIYAIKSGMGCGYGQCQKNKSNETIKTKIIYFFILAIKKFFNALRNIFFKK